MAKRLIGLAVITIMLIGAIGLTACNNASLEEYKVAGKALIDAHIATKTQSDYSTEKWTDVLSIATEGKQAVENATNKDGVTVEKTKDAIDMGYYEIEVDNMVDCSSFFYCSIRSHLNPIKLKYADKNVQFNCIVDKGNFLINNSQNVKNVTLKSGDGFHWRPYEKDENGQFTSKYKVERAFVEIILKNDENIIGYAIVEMYPVGKAKLSFKAKTLKSAIFPKIEDEYQNITEYQVRSIINKIKGGNEL